MLHQPVTIYLTISNKMTKKKKKTEHVYQTHHHHHRRTREEIKHTRAKKKMFQFHAHTLKSENDIYDFTIFRIVKSKFLKKRFKKKFYLIIHTHIN